MRHSLPQLLRSCASFAVLAALALVAIAGSPAHAQTAPADPAADETAAPQDTTVTWGVRPANLEQHEADRPNFAYLAEPGETIADALVVSNHNPDELTLRVYAADAFTNERGVLDLLLPGEPSAGVGAWVEVETDEIVIPPGETVDVPFVLRVPDAAEPGDHAGGIITSLLSESDAGFSTDRRLGSRIHLRVDGELAPALDATGARVGYAGTLNPLGTGAADVEVEVVNDGNARIGGEAQITVRGPFGLAARTTTAEIPELLPGERFPVAVELGRVLPLFLLRAEVTVTGTVAVSGDEIEPVVATASTAAIPWTLLGLLVLLLALAWLQRWRAKRRAAHTARLIDEAVTAARNEDTPTSVPSTT